MAEAHTINNEELSILCDLMGGWSAKKWAENPAAIKKQTLDRLIADGYVETVQEEEAATNYRYTTKTELLFAQLCVGISGALILR
jgi:hypothetical protein